MNTQLSVRHHVELRIAPLDAVIVNDDKPEETP